MLQSQRLAPEAVQVRHPADHRSAELLRERRRETIPRSGQEQSHTVED